MFCSRLTKTIWTEDRNYHDVTIKLLVLVRWGLCPLYLSAGNFGSCICFMFDCCLDQGHCI